LCTAQILEQSAPPLSAVTLVIGSIDTNQATQEASGILFGAPYSAPIGGDMLTVIPLDHVDQVAMDMEALRPMSHKRHYVN
jgi:hypothetical protein